MKNLAKSATFVHLLSAFAHSGNPSLPAGEALDKNGPACDYRRSSNVFVKNRLKLVGNVVGVAVTAILLIGIWASGATAQVSFKEDVFPILQLRCLECHQPGGEGYEKSGLDMRTYEGLMKGTNHGPMVIPGDAIQSNLLAVIEQRTSSKIWMPHNKKQISKCERQALRFWVMQGAQNN